MKIKISVILGIIIVICTIVNVFCYMNYHTKANNVDVPEMEEGLSNEEIVNITIENCTGHKMNSFYVSQPENEEYLDEDGNKTWYDILEGDSVEEGETFNISLENGSAENLWEFMVENDEGEFETNGSLTPKVIYDGATVKVYIVDSYLGVYNTELFKGSNNNQNEEDNKSETEISLMLINGTGKKIEKLYFSQKNNERYVGENGEKISENIIDSTGIQALDVLSGIEIKILKLDDTDAVDFIIVNDDGEFTLKEYLSKKLVYDGATLEMYIKDGKLEVCDITDIVNSSK